MNAAINQKQAGRLQKLAFEHSGGQSHQKTSIGKFLSYYCISTLAVHNIEVFWACILYV